MQVNLWLSRGISNLGSSFGTAVAGTILVAAVSRGYGVYTWAIASLIVFGLIGLDAALRLPGSRDRSAEFSPGAAGAV